MNALSALFGVLKHAGTRRDASITFTDDTRHVRPLVGVMIQLGETFGDIACCVHLVVLLFDARI